MDNHKLTMKALVRLRPDGFSWTGEDIKDIIWANSDDVTPSKTEIDKAKAEILAELEAKEKAKLAAEAKLAADKASAIAKLAAIGLTEDEAKAVIGA